MSRSNAGRSKLAMVLAAALTSGTLFLSCQTRFKDAVVDGATSYLFSILDPETIVGLIVEPDDAAD